MEENKKNYIENEKENKTTKPTWQKCALFFILEHFQFSIVIQTGEIRFVV